MLPKNVNLRRELLSSSKSKAFKCSKHVETISDQIQTFYKQKLFCDIVIIAGIDNIKLPAHRLVLGAKSGSFLAMCLLEATSDEIEIKQIDCSTLKLILDFIYTGSIELRNENIESVLSAARLFQLHTLITACCDFMGEQLDVGNCLTIAMFADQHNYLQLEAKCLTFACEHFDQFCDDEEFLLLTNEQLKKFITADSRSERAEEKLFLNIIKWIQYDTNREQYIYDIISLLRFKMLDPEFIIANRHFVCKTIECYELACTWLEYHMPLKNCDQHETNKKLAFSTGIKNNCLSLYTFNSEENNWVATNITRPNQKRSDSWCMLGMDKILAAVANYADSYGNSIGYITCVALESKGWFDLPPMKQKVNIKLLVELNDELYVFGSYIGTVQNAVEKYNFITRYWQILMPITISRVYQVANVSGVLYIIYSGLSLMQCYDPVNNEWIDKPRKKVVMERFGMAAVCGQLYTVGGITNGKNCQTVERYNPSDNTWTVVDLKVYGGPTQCTSINNRLIIYCREQPGSNMIEYNPQTNKTTILGEMPQTSTKKFLLSMCKS